MSIHYFRMSPRYIIMFAAMVGLALVALRVYVKYFEDKVVLETFDTAMVLEAQEIEGKSVGANRSIVKLELKDGTQAKVFGGVPAPKVGSIVDVEVQTFESGERNISLAETFGY